MFRYKILYIELENEFYDPVEKEAVCSLLHHVISCGELIYLKSHFLNADTYLLRYASDVDRRYYRFISLYLNFFQNLLTYYYHYCGHINLNHAVHDVFQDRNLRYLDVEGSILRKTLYMFSQKEYINFLFQTTSYTDDLHYCEMVQKCMEEYKGEILELRDLSRRVIISNIRCPPVETVYMLPLPRKVQEYLLSC